MNNPVTKANQPVTYNEGEGVKDQIVMTGPLSEVLSRALSVFLEKKPLVTEETPPEMPATESYSQDAYMESMLASMSNTPGLDLVLDNFDISDVKDHVARARAGDLDAQLNAPAPTTIYVTDANDVTSPRTAETLIDQNQDSNSVVVVVQGNTSLGADQGTELLTTAQMKEATERIYEGTGLTVCWGLEALCNHLLITKFKTVEGVALANEGFIDKVQELWSKNITKAQGIKEKLLTKQKEFKSAFSFWPKDIDYSKPVDLEMSDEWKHLSKNGKITASGIIDIAGQLEDLCLVTREFVEASFEINQKTNAVGFFSPNGMAESVRRFYKPYERSEKNSFDLYRGINNQRLTISLINQGKDENIQNDKPTIVCEIVGLNDALPTMFSLKWDDLRRIGNAIEKSQDEWLFGIDGICAIQRKLGRAALDAGDSEVKSAVLVSYNRLISTLLAGIFEETLKLVDACILLDHAVTKKYKK